MFEMQGIPFCTGSLSGLRSKKQQKRLITLKPLESYEARPTETLFRVILLKFDAFGLGSVGFFESYFLSLLQAI